jgi:hypothetical protein
MPAIGLCFRSNLRGQENTRKKEKAFKDFLGTTNCPVNCILAVNSY